MNNDQYNLLTGKTRALEDALISMLLMLNTSQPDRADQLLDHFRGLANQYRPERDSADHIKRVDAAKGTMLHVVNRVEALRA